MPELVHWLQFTELDRLTAAELAERISEAEQQHLGHCRENEIVGDQHSIPSYGIADLSDGSQ